VLGKNDFSKTAAKQHQRNRNDAIGHLYCIFSALKKLRKVVCLVENVFLKWPSISALRACPLHKWFSVKSQSCNAFAAMTDAQKQFRVHSLFDHIVALCCNRQLFVHSKNSLPAWGIKNGWISGGWIRSFDDGEWLKRFCYKRFGCNKRLVVACISRRGITTDVLIPLLQTETLSISPKQKSQKDNCKNFTLPTLKKQ